MSGHSQPPANNQSTTSVTAQEQADTHRSLQQASQALELASNRIRQVRRSLLQLSDSLPSNERIARIGMYDDLRPAHDALLLTGADGIQRPTSVRADRRRFRMIPLEGAVPSLPVGTAVRTEHTTSSAATALASRVDVLRSMINADPSATTRGMRVAAREAMLQQAQNTPDGLTPASQDRGELLVAPDPTLDQAYASLQARYDRLQRMLGTGSLDSDLQRTDDINALGPSLSIAERVTRRWGPFIPLNANAVTRTVSPTLFVAPPSPANLPRNGLSTPRPLPAASLPSDAETASTTGAPDGSTEQYRLLLQDLLLADYPILNTEQTRDDTPSWSAAQDLVPASGRESQGYLRRENSRIFQYVAPPDVEEVNNQPSQNQIPSPSAEGDGSLPGERSSRRAWARLDADGDEIPPNEEEELERQRTSYRVRAQQRARQHLTSNQVDSARSLARLDGPRDMHGSVIDSTRTVPDVRRQQPLLASYTPVGAEVKDPYVNPLPMPLESMVMTTDSIDSPGEEDIFIDIVFPKNACIAGR